MSVLDHPVVNVDAVSAPAASPRTAPPLVRRRIAVAESGRLIVITATVVVVLTAWNLSGPVMPAAAIAASIWFAALRSVYASNWLSPRVVGAPIASATGSAIGLAGVAAAVTLLPGLEHFDPLVLLIMTAGVALAACSYDVVVDRRLLPQRRLLVVGAAKGGSELVAALQDHPELPFDCIGVVDDSDEWIGERIRGGVDDLPAVIEREHPDLVVLAGVRERERAMENLLDRTDCRFQLVEVHHFYEHAFGRVPLQDLSPAWFMSVLHLYRRRYSRVTKRAFDLALAVAMLVVAAPFLLLAAVLVRSSGRGPILFRQIRLGEGGRPFEIYKFRTMIVDAESDGRATWATRNDPRITSVGRMLRRTRLDELPQLWNVVLGDMSMVGPRPERPEFLERLAAEVPFWTRRHLAKPGITGWAQLQCGYTSDSLGAAEKLSYDLFYLKHRTLLLDIAIAAKTAAVVVTGRGAH
jgi:exopolysaccharide biosynthesis polyprenyl glycosylphosphotransferase